ncbi:HNH endonuclease [Pseudomonas fluorescens]|jgi:hypothetical protein|uniref:HNH nuclease domain-containing protein n=1 Tax=Pseudomonas fluorescens TaxID=294 RepID=A0A5E7THT7_PSEFL|nr:HNH endonuclease [Pseudomonas fluorescens]VVP97575.1 hypothetical protein PS922_03323 [Pseudomonas fluorescens]
MTSKVKINPLPPIEVLEARYRLVDHIEGIVARDYIVNPGKSKRGTKDGDQVGSLTNKQGRRQAEVTWLEDGEYRCVRVQVSRIVYRMAHGPFDESLYVDHIDGDPSNNHPSNLRTCTAQENMRNAKRRDTKTDALPKGIRKVGDEYHVFIDIGNGKGPVPFQNIRAASQYATQIRNRYHGEFARD